MTQDNRPKRGGADERSQKSCEHGTPTNGVELARYALGRLDLDPCSSSYWNYHSVKAARFFDRRIDGLKQPWSGTMIVNPPGADEDAGTENLVRPCWDKLVEHWRAGDVEGAVWWGYSLEQLQALQADRTWHPARCLTVLLAGRPRHLVRPVRVERRPDGVEVRVPLDGPPRPGPSPMHGGFATLLPSIRFRAVAEQQVARFVERARGLGQLVRPHG